MRERNGPCYHWANCIFHHFQFWLLWPRHVFIHGIQKPAANRRCSPASTLTFQNVSSEKSFLFAWWVALTRPLSRVDSVPTSPACSELGPKKDRNSPCWSKRPRQSGQAAAGNNRLYLLAVLKIPRVCTHFPLSLHIVYMCASTCRPIIAQIIKKLHAKMCTCLFCFCSYMWQH